MSDDESNTFCLMGHFRRPRRKRMEASSASVDEEGKNHGGESKASVPGERKEGSMKNYAKWSAVTPLGCQIPGSMIVISLLSRILHTPLTPFYL